MMDPNQLWMVEMLIFLVLWLLVSWLFDRLMNVFQESLTLLSKCPITKDPVSFPKVPKKAVSTVYGETRYPGMKKNRTA